MGRSQQMWSCGFVTRKFDGLKPFPKGEFVNLKSKIENPQN